MEVLLFALLIGLLVWFIFTLFRKFKIKQLISKASMLKTKPIQAIIFVIKLYIYPLFVWKKVEESKLPQKKSYAILLVSYFLVFSSLMVSYLFIFKTSSDLSTLENNKFNELDGVLVRLSKTSMRTNNTLWIKSSYDKTILINFDYFDYSVLKKYQKKPVVITYFDSSFGTRELISLSSGEKKYGSIKKMHGHLKERTNKYVFWFLISLTLFFVIPLIRYRIYGLIPIYYRQL